MKKLIPILMLFIGFQTVAQIRIEGRNTNGRVLVEVGGNNNYYRDQHYSRYIRPYDYLRLSRHQEAILYDALYRLESRRLSQRAYDDMLYRDLQRILDRNQFRTWENRYCAKRSYHKPHYNNHGPRGKAKGHYKKHDNRHKNHGGHKRYDDHRGHRR